MNDAADPVTPQRPHHRHLEQARAQVIELLSRQSVERDLLQRSVGENGKQNVVAQLVARQHQAALETRLAGFHPADIAFVLESLESEARDLAWSLVKPERRGAVLLETSDAVRRALVAGMPPAEIASLVAPLDSDDIADLVGSLPDEVGQQVLELLDNADQAEVRSMLSFPDGTVGALMDMEFVSVREDASLEAVQRLLRRRKTLPAHTNQIFVVDRGNHLLGLLSLSRLILGDPEAPVSAEMTRKPVYFYTDDRMREAINAFEKYDLVSAPVLNLHEQVIGRITVDAVVDAIKEDASSESLRQVGLSEDEDLFGPVKPSARNRWPWIGLNLVTSFGSSRVIGVFDDVIAQFTAVATLIPIVASLGGNTGTQTMELVIRALALDRLGPTQLRRTFVKEMLVALLNGSLWGAALGAMTFLLYGKFKLALVIYAAMVVELVVGAFAGVAIPVTLKRLGRDPVMGSSVILTAITDSVGFFIFLGLATLFLFDHGAG